METSNLSLWKRLEHCITTGQETRKIDLKRELSLGKPNERAKFAKDVLALANTFGGPGYLVIGVLDARARTSTDPNTYVPGFVPPDLDQFRRHMSQALSNNADLVPEYHYEQFVHPAAGRMIGVVVVERGLNPPYRAKENVKGMIEGQVYFRIGAETFTATPEQEEALQGGRSGMFLVLNFGRPIEPDQLARLAEIRGAKINEVIAPPNPPVYFDHSSPFAEQTVRLLDELGLTREEWQSLPIVVNLPGLANAAAALIAELHGRMGHFPDVIRIRPEPDNRDIYQVAEVLHLQQARDDANSRQV